MVFVIGSVLHGAVNLKPTLRHLRRPLGAALATFCLLAAVLGMWPRGGQAGNLRQTLQRAGDVLLDLTPGELATATRQPREVVADRIRAAGFQVPDGDATLRAIAIWNHRPAFQILAVATSPAGTRS